MNSTALGAKENIIFISDAHEKFYYEKLEEVRYQDVYHKALCYCLGISDDTRRNIMDCQHFFRQIFLGYFPCIVQVFDIPRKNVCGDDYTSLHNPIVLSSVLLVCEIFHSTQILF